MLYLVKSEQTIGGESILNIDIVKADHMTIKEAKKILGLDDSWNITEYEELTLDDIEEYLLKGEKYFTLAEINGD